MSEGAGAGSPGTKRKAPSMKKIAVVAADGRVARKAIKEAVDRGFDVTAFGRRDENTGDAQTYVKKDIMDLAKEDLEGFDAVIDAFGAWTPETLPQHSTTLEHLCHVLAGTDVRLVVVGGAGSLYLDGTHTAQVQDLDSFPEGFRPLAHAMGVALDELRSVKDVRWTYVSPAGDFQADGPRTGSYVLAGEEYTADENGVSAISYADYAIALIDEIGSGSHIQERISVRW